MAFGSEPVITFNDVAETASESETDLVCPLLSLTRAAKGKVPVTEVVPERTPAEVREMPEGREPEFKDHAYGVLPPVAVRVAE